jgi:hypothetical protein
VEDVGAVGHAFDTGRNVVPVAAGGFECPPADALPPALVELPRQQWVRYDHEFSDESIERVYRMLRSRRATRGAALGRGWGRPLRWAALGMGAVILGLFALGAVLSGSSGTRPDFVAGGLPPAQLVVLRRGRLQALPTPGSGRARRGLLLPGAGDRLHLPVNDGSGGRRGA